MEPGILETPAATNNVEVIAQPTRSVVIRAQPGQGSLFVHPSSHGWTFDGFVFDGDMTSNTWVVKVEGFRTTIRRSIIENGSGNYCLGITGPRANNRFMKVDLFTLEQSEVRNCVDPNNRNKDIHCVHSYSGERVLIRDNHIWNCQGDGVQLENDYDSLQCYTTSPNQTCQAGVWREVDIVSNVIESKPDDALAQAWGQAAGVGIRPGENAIDIKAGKGGVRIVGNVIKGYRSYNSATGVGLGSGHPDNQGSAITLSGPFVDCPPNRPCVLIEGNDISNSTTGIALAQAPAFDHISAGSTDDIIIRRNVIHSLSARFDHATDASQRGAGLRVGRKVSNLSFRHNTIANTPGAGLYADSGIFCANCEISDNALSFAGFFGSANNCNSGVWDPASGLALDRNLCAPANDPRRECTINGNGSTASIRFRGPNEGVTNPLAVPTACGTDAPALPGMYDFSLASSSLAKGRAGTNGSPGSAQCNDVGAPDSSATWDTGAKEFCSAHTIYMNFDPTSEAKVWVETTDWYRAFAEFVYSKGNYANALSFDELPNSFCQDPAGQLQCLLYTRRCADICGTHPNGEIDCSCMPNIEKAFGLRPPAQDRWYVDSNLRIDWNSDGQYDETRWPWSSDPQGNPYRAVGSSRISDLEHTQEWEDLDTSPTDGDRNDYIASVRAVACSQEGVEQAASVRAEAGCFASEISCQECGRFSPDEVAVSASLSADLEGTSEREGRSLFVHVTAWRSTENPAASPSEPRIAVCPVLVLKNEGEVRFVNYHGGSTHPCGSPATAEGVPACARTERNNARISFGKLDTQRQGPDDVCKSLPKTNEDLALDDSFVLEHAKSCGPQTLPAMKSLLFEVKWDDLAQASNGAIDTGLPLNDVRSHVDRLDVYVFSDITTPRFMCPDGVNIGLDELNAISTHVGRVNKYSVSAPDIGERK